MTAPALSEQEARALVNRFKAIAPRTEKHVKDIVRASYIEARDILKTFADGLGWLALGYRTWNDCYRKEFGYSRGHLHRLVKAAELETELIEGAKQGAIELALLAGIELVASPNGDKDEQRAIEGQLRQLTDPRLRQEVRALAAQTAMNSGRLPTASDVAQAVQVVTTQARDADREAVMASGKYALIVQKMNKGEVKPKIARAWMDALDSIAPSLRMGFLKWEVTDAAVIRGLAERSKSDTFAEVMRTGQLQYADGSAVPLKMATSRQVADLFMERSKEHRLQGKAITADLFIFKGRVIERDPISGTITLQVPMSALDNLPMGAEIEFDARWEVAKGVA